MNRKHQEKSTQDDKICNQKNKTNLEITSLEKVQDRHARAFRKTLDGNIAVRREEEQNEKRRWPVCTCFLIRRRKRETKKKSRHVCHESIEKVEEKGKLLIRVEEGGMCTSICVLEQNSTELFQNKLINANSQEEQENVTLSLLRIHVTLWAWFEFHIHCSG